MILTVLTTLIALTIGGVSGRAQNPPAPAAGVSAQTGKPGPVASQPASTAVEKKEENCGCEAPNPSGEIAAVVDGIKITHKEIEDRIRDEKARLQKEVVDARRRELNLQINSRLLEAEARRKATTAANLLEREILARVKEPTETEVQAFYAENKDRIRGSLKEYRQHIGDYLKGQRQEAAARNLADRLRSEADIKVLVSTVTAPEKDSDRATVLAIINGEKITSGDVEDSLKPLIFDVQLRVHELIKGELELRINDLLLEREAQKRKITTGALVDADLTPTVNKVSEEQARKFFDDNKDRIDGDYDQLKEQIIDYLQNREQRKAEVAFAAKLRQGARIEINLNEPASPVFQIATDDQPSLGRTDAPVTIVEFTDFECSTCQQAHPILKRLVQEYPDRVRLVVRDFPLEKHQNAFKAAEAAEAAREQGKYWDYSAVLFENQKALDTGKLKDYASEVGLDRKKFDAELESGKYAVKVQRDMQDGLRAGVSGTPAIFINGRRVSERTYDRLRAAIEEELSKPPNN